MTVEGYSNDEWDIDADGVPAGLPLTGINVTTVLPGAVVIRLEYAASAQQLQDLQAGRGRPKSLQVAVTPDVLREILPMLSEAASDAEQMASAPRN